MFVENNIQDSLPTGGIAEPYTWWNLFSLGPFESSPDIELSKLPFLTPPVEVIQSGKPAYIAAVMYLNPNPILPPAPGISPCTFLSNLSLPYEISFESIPPIGTPLQHKHVRFGNLIPRQCFYVKILEITTILPPVPTPVPVIVKVTACIRGDLPSEQDESQFHATATWGSSLTQEMLDNAFIEGRRVVLPVKFAIQPPG